MLRLDSIICVMQSLLNKMANVAEQYGLSTNIKITEILIVKNAGFI